MKLLVSFDVESSKLKVEEVEKELSRLIGGNMLIKMALKANGLTVGIVKVSEIK